MAANKKRKLNALASPKNISAFAARNQLYVASDIHESGLGTTYRPNEQLVHSEEKDLIKKSSLSTASDSSGKCDRVVGRELGQSSPDDAKEEQNSSDSDGHNEGSTTSAVSNQLWTRLTTVDLANGNIDRLKDGAFQIRIGPGERLVVLGEYGLAIVKGQITVLGAILSPSQSVHDICAASSHSLPVIRFFSSDTEKAEVILYPSKSKLRSLMQLSPFFAGLWSSPSSHLEVLDEAELKPWKLSGSSFQILLSRDENHRMGYTPVASPPEWNELLSTSALVSRGDGKTSLTVVCGPKSSGKSTFSKLLANRLLTASQTQGAETVAFLDLDPGQPEFSTPGQVSLLLLSKPNLGIPFSHPDSSKNGTKLIRAHSISAASPSSDPEFYMACVTNLISCYLRLRFPIRPPLVVNTPGWILGTGLELLINLIKEARPTQIVYMSQDGPYEVVESLQAAAKSIPVLKLPSHPAEGLPRTSAQLRTMQYMSYFHLDPVSFGNYVWSSDPIVSIPPLQVKYAGNSAGILGIMCFGEQPPPRMLREAINGSLVAVVVIEDEAAILSSDNSEKRGKDLTGQLGKDLSMSMGNSDEGVVELPSTEQLHQREGASLILQTSEGIPYFNPAIAVTLDPSCSHTIGAAMIRGVDTRQRKLQLLTPIPPKSIVDIRASGKAIILVSGKLDTPGWAYLEALYKKDVDITEENMQQQPDEAREDNRDVDNFEGVPWIEVLHGDRGRDIGGRVWRVRRDLGKTGTD